MKKNILILTTGGTIASVESKDGLIPQISASQLLALMPNIDKKYLLDTVEVCNLDSTDMSYKQWLLIAKTIKENYHKYDGFVICHGTDTLAYTASALSYLIQNSKKPIVLTGSQKPIGSEITDAKANLYDSILYAGNHQSQGVTIVFGGKVIAGTRAKKTKTTSFSAFDSINFPQLAVILDGKIIRYIKQEPFEEDVRFYDTLNPKVFLLKLTPGIEPTIIESIFETYDCIIVESFGVGGMPETLMESFLKAMKKYDSPSKIVILTTQVTYEGSNATTYEVGNRLLSSINCIEAKDMTIEAVLSKAMWVMADKGLDFGHIKAAFQTEINYDTVL